MNDVAPLVAVDIRILNQILDLFDFLTNSDSATPICVLAWFNYPKVLAELRVEVQDCLFGLVGLRVKLFELKELRIVEPLFNVECDWKRGVVLHADRLIVDFHVVVDCFLVA